MRRALRSVYERRGIITLILAIVATALAIAALGLAGYAVHQILTNRQDVWLVYSQAPDFTIIAAIATPVAIALSVLAVSFKRRVYD